MIIITWILIVSRNNKILLFLTNSFYLMTWWTKFLFTAVLFSYNFIPIFWNTNFILILSCIANKKPITIYSYRYYLRSFVKIKFENKTGVKIIVFISYILYLSAIIQIFSNFSPHFRLSNNFRYYSNIFLLWNSRVYQFCSWF